MRRNCRREMFLIHLTRAATRGRQVRSARAPTRSRAGTGMYRAAQGTQPAVDFGPGSGAVRGLSPLRHETMISTKEENKREDPHSAMATC